VFHVELRQFPHAARAFNLTAEQLEARFTGPWVREQTVALDDRRWAPERAKLTIYERDELRTDELGLGRGWASVTKDGTDVTQHELTAARERSQPGESPAALHSLTDELAALTQAGPVGAAEVLGLVAGAYPGASDSERRAIAARLVWELLEAERAKLG
jgi:hypothetical protein